MLQRSGRVGVVIALLGLLMVAFAVMPVAAAPGDKWFVCKYVFTPGEGEQLQSGQNPISVSESAIPVSPVFPGLEFADNQGRSIVLEQDVGQPEPDPSECPPPGGGSPSPTPTLPPPGVPSLFAVPCDPTTGAPSQIQIEAAVLAGLRLFLDGTEEFFDGNGVLEVAPGTYDWVITEADGTTVLASGTVTVDPCGVIIETPTPSPSVPGESVPPPPDETPTDGDVPPPDLPDTALPMNGIVGVMGVIFTLFGSLLLLNARSVLRRR